MKAAVLVGKERFEIQETDNPKCGQGEILVKVKSCAICGTDLRIFRGEKRIDVPITGHEISGVIEEVGNGVSGYFRGEKVAIETVIGCGKCDACRNGEENRCRNKYKAIGYQYNGGFAQFLLVPKEAVRQGCVLKIPEHVSFDEACIVEPLSCVINGWHPFKKRTKNFVVVIIGAGIIGMLHTEYAKHLGARVILVNRSSPRLILAKKIGLQADFFVDASKEDPVEKVLELTDGVGADVIICATSDKDVQKMALEMAAVDADISYFAGVSKDDPYVQIDSNLIHYNELHIHGANASNRRQYLEAIDLIASRKVNVRKFITHKFPLEKIEEAFKMLEDRGSNALKVIIDPWM
ncbi:MAG: alcohol dehydrogenase catalytic domain-containing protein [Nitrososphaerota archaeon]|nr:alcohol dehydrogenase catalytic domain-containing protein [Candidatus Bathyarchaeota archaeon]MDW8048682.1 alcohol dehydrogenase catalytic domain-containing protein [Nitrososphaerota archaeon]